MSPLPMNVLNVTEPEFMAEEELRIFRDGVSKFFAQHAPPERVEKWRENGIVEREFWREAGQGGILGVSIPAEYGGGGGDFRHDLVVFEEQAKHGVGGFASSLHNGIVVPYVLAHGTEEQKQTWLPDLTAGRALAAFGLTEPEAGSDAGATRTRAREDGDEWVVDGAKAFITNSGTAITSVVTITARTGPDEISTLMVPAGTPGFIVDPGYEKLGWRISDTHGLTFEGCRVPKGNLLGERGRGFAQFLATLDDGRIAISALALGLAEACLEECRTYAQQRHSFGAPIGSRQGVAFAISDVAVSVEAARLLTYKAAWLKDSGRPRAEVKQAASIAKLYSSEAAMAAARTATQIFGGNGFMEEYPVARYYRDAKILEIGEGTSEVQRILIARGLGLPVA